MFERITKNPIASALWAGAVWLGTIGGVWFFFTSQAPGPVLMGLAAPLLTMGTVGTALVVAGLVLPLAVFVVIAVSAVKGNREVKRLAGVAADLEEKFYGLTRERGTLLTKQALLVDERDAAIAAHKDTKHEYAMEILVGHSRMVFPPDNVKPTVTVRHCSYTGDDKLAEQIKGLLTQYAQWPVDIDASNNPALERAEKCKVVFDVGTTLSYGALIRAFIKGDFLGVPICENRNDRKNVEHLIIKVLPSASGSSRA